MTKLVEKNKTLSIIIPLYNEEKNIEKLLQKVVNVKLFVNKEIIVVDDGSKDNSKIIVKKFIDDFKNFKAKTNPSINIKLISKKNGGKGSALKVGFEKATGEIFIIQDSDLEYEPNDYAKLIKPILDSKYKVVYGSRILNKKNTYSHKSFLYGGKLVSLVTSILYFTKLTDEPTCYKVFHKDFKDILVNAKGNKFEWEPEVTAKILRLGHKIKEIPISYYPRTKKEGKKIRWSDGIDAVWTLFIWRFKKIK